jgi:FtsZ-interacting cell division protein YlmF
MFTREDSTTDGAHLLSWISTMFANEYAITEERLSSSSGFIGRSLEKIQGNSSNPKIQFSEKKAISQPTPTIKHNKRKAASKPTPTKNSKKRKAASELTPTIKNSNKQKAATQPTQTLYDDNADGITIRFAPPRSYDEIIQNLILNGADIDLIFGYDSHEQNSTLPGRSP